ncbi:glycosyltransferase involved in cell wall biosynthesis [Thermohydrogenium kirishiense]|nr:glycosyltransferase involved in cell wall biosynthesis [Thermohydrogenium kirishiense]
MNVIIDVRMINENLHGIARYTYELIKNFIKLNDIKIYLLTCDNKFKEKILNQNEDIRYIIVKSGFLSIREPIELPIKLNKYKNEAIFHSPSFVSSPFIRCPTIMTIHDLNHLKFPEYYTKFHKYYYNYIVKPSALNAKKVLTVSNFSKMEIVNWLKCDSEKVVVTYNGVDENFKVINDKDKLIIIRKKYDLPQKFVLYIGNLKPHKNITNLIKAIKKINQEIMLVINGESNEILNKIIKENNLENKVKFIGYVDDDDLPALYNLAELFVYPSLYEGFGLPPLEAMACGCPVITSNTSSLPEVVGEAGIMVNPYNVEEIARAIDLVLLNENLRREMIEKGLKQAKKFSWRKTAEETLKVYEDVYKETFGGE